MPEQARPALTAYTGNEPYVFVSYAHVDAGVVYPILSELAAQYFRIWYDEGIRPGRIWRNTIVERVRACACVLAFLTPRAVQSQHVLRELNAAQKYRRQVYPVFLKETRLPEGLAEHVLRFQVIKLYETTVAGCRQRLVEHLPAETRRFRSSDEELQFIERALQDPAAMFLLRSSTRQERLGWCGIHRRGAPFNDFIQTCKMCGDTDWFEPGTGIGNPGIAGSERCPSCGLSRDPGTAKPWFTVKKCEGENVLVTCNDCKQEVEYAFDDGPPLLCPRCGRIQYD